MTDPTLVLDAGVVIALMDANDAHHEAAVELLDAHVDAEFVMNPLNYAEALVGPAAHGKLPDAVAHLQAVGVQVVEIPASAGVQLAHLRAQTGSKMPDSCLLLTAQELGAQIVTFDDRLRRAATSLGVDVLSAPTG